MYNIFTRVVYGVDIGNLRKAPGNPGSLRKQVFRHYERTKNKKQKTNRKKKKYLTSSSRPTNADAQ